MRLYEGMFVASSSLAKNDWDGVCGDIESIISKHGGKVVDLRKWDERRLAYEINHVRRGTYILVHFEAPPLSMEEMRRDFNLSEKILRQLVVIDVDGVPTGDERPGITTTITDASARGRFGRGAPVDRGATTKAAAEKPAGESAKVPAEESVEVAAEEPAEAPAEMPAEEPAEAPTEEKPREGAASAEPVEEDK